MFEGARRGRREFSAVCVVASSSEPDERICWSFLERGFDLINFAWGIG